jgi:hypothetical protein
VRESRPGNLRVSPPVLDRERETFSNLLNPMSNYLI